MTHRGPILLIFGGSLFFSPLAIRLWQMQDSEYSAPSEVQTEGASAAACDAQSVDTPRRRLGCVNGTERLSSRRTMAGGGAVFISVAGS
jgi:hypothetical protein